MPFQKGKTGNPNGRPKKTDDYHAFVQACRKMTPEALAVVAANMNAEEGAVRQRAAECILDRAWGKPQQVLQAPEGGHIEAMVIRWHAPAALPEPEGR